MADIDDGIEALKNLAASSDIASSSLDLLTGAWDKVSSGATSAASAITNNNSIFNKFISEGISGFDLMDKVISNATGNITNFGLKAGLAVEPLIGILPKGINQFGELGKVGSDAGTQISDSFTRLHPLLQKLVPKPLMTGFEGLFASADKARNLEIGLIRSAAAAGDLNSIISVVGHNMEGLSDESASYAETTYRVAQATNTSVDVVSKYAQMLLEIPGALRTNIGEGDSAIQNMSLLTGAMKVASGTGQEFTNVQKQMAFAYRELGLTGEDSLAFVAQMATASQDLQLPMDIVRRYTEQTSGAFKLLGDNTEATINILAGMKGALNDSGLGPQALADITSGITEGISKLDVAHRAFISQQAGGPGGLAGGYQILQLQQEGKVDEVFKMIQQAMEDVGGSIVTLSEAAQDEGAAAQFTKQIALLKDVFGVASTEKQAVQILEAMSKGDILGFKEKIGPGEALTGRDEALSQSIERGNAIQERSSDVFKVMSNGIDRLSQLQAINNDIMLRSAFGINSANSNLKELRDQNRALTANIGAIGETGTRRTNVEELGTGTITEIEDTVKSGFDSFNVIKDSFIDQMTELKNKNTTAPIEKPISAIDLETKPITENVVLKPSEVVDKNIIAKALAENVNEKKNVPSNELMNVNQEKIKLNSENLDLISNSVNLMSINRAVLPVPRPPISPEQVMRPKEEVQRTITEKVVRTSTVGPIDDVIHITIDSIDNQGNVRRIANEEVKKEFKRRDQRAFTSGTSE